ncbi:OLC1v1016679C1 [Oldenlandia corymbosa var. corymbosa]|uniref:OLC1v1016679C1 n=1 Tax=Oldenlandia corymbosa var. corymbosa TaxID=529605 RepID=A0AAV1E7P1_OLDCO|nr:OLC1v1016679C1 [Oldenlandia corymbosa var. corymbosa]
MERCRRHMTDSPGCDFCGAAQETILHALRDCPAAAQIWYRLVRHHMRSWFFSLQLLDWVLKNVKWRGAGLRDDWSCYFGVTVWRLWSWRYGRLFKGSDGGAMARVRDIETFVDKVHQSTVHEKQMGKRS